MVKLARILRDYADAGSLNELLAVWGFLDDAGTFLTKAGHVGVVYELKGIDCENLTHAERHTLVRHVEAGLRLLDEHSRIYQYLFKRTTTSFTSAECRRPLAQEAVDRRSEDLNRRRRELYDFSQYLALVYEPPFHGNSSTRLRGVMRSPRAALAHWLSTARNLELLWRIAHE